VIDAHRKVIAEALEAATVGSVITSCDEVTLKTEDGQELKITTRIREPSAATAELVSGGETLDAAPSGTFVVAGETLTLDKGRVVRTGESSGPLAWAAFALLTEDRVRTA
jgi:hypothetical protein